MLWCNSKIFINQWFLTFLQRVYQEYYFSYLLCFPLVALATKVAKYSEVFKNIPIYTSNKYKFSFKLQGKTYKWIIIFYTEVSC